MAPWAPAVFFFGLAFLTSAFLGAMLGGATFAIALVVLLLVGHGLAIAIGSKFQYLATIVTGVENRRTGSCNLSQDEVSSYEFYNL